MTTTKFPVKYKNGNCDVELWDNGTKVRRWPDGEEPTVEFPESIDLKITNWCDGWCWHCHERSTTSGQHADEYKVWALLRDLPAGVEIALGGGDPLSYPYLEELLLTLREQGLVVNITVNMKHLERHRELIKTLRRRKMIHGLGMSYDKEVFVPKDLIHENNVVHFIAGVHSPADARDYLDSLRFIMNPTGSVESIDYTFKKMLLLGYKSYGRGESKSFDDVKDNVLEWAYKMPSLYRKWGYVAFDTLSLQQFGDEPCIPGQHGQFFMGADGEFTMYVDAVKMEYAKSSISPRMALKPMQTAREAFKEGL